MMTAEQELDPSADSEVSSSRSAYETNASANLTSRVVHNPSGHELHVYRDAPDADVAHIRSYSSRTSGPAETPYRKTRHPSLFASWGTRSDASLLLRNLYMDIIRNPSPATKDIFLTICDTCKKGNISLASITDKVDDHDPIFWMIVRRKAMPGTIEAFLSQTNKLTEVTARDVQEGQAACLVIDSVDLYRLLETHRSYPQSYRGSRSNMGDIVEIIMTEDPVLGFIANIKFNDFIARYRVQKDLTISFPARHREWTFHVGTSRVPDRFLRRPHNYGESRKVMELLLATGDPIPCTARVRLRHPSHAVESEWLDLGSLTTVTEAMRHADTRAVRYVGFCGPSVLSSNKAWQALELGDAEYVDQEGELTVQLQLVAANAPAQTSGGDCCIQ